MSLFVSAGWPCDVCRTDTVPLGPFSVHQERACCAYVVLTERCLCVPSVYTRTGVPPIYIGDFQISSFFHMFYPLSFFLRAGWPYDLCRTHAMMPLGPISLKPGHQTRITPHPVPPRHQAQIRQHGTHHRRNRNPPSAQTTEIEALGQPPSARNHAQTPQRRRART